MERTSGPDLTPVARPPAPRTEVRKTLRPGERGTKKLVKRHGDDLVCVRYRYDERAGLRLTTVELVVERARWKPPRRIPDSTLVSVKVEPWERSLQERLRKAGARWDPRLRLWRMRYDKAVDLRIRKRIVTRPPGEKSRQI
jgi:hypothetical protein